MSDEANQAPAATESTADGYPAATNITLGAGDDQIAASPEASSHVDTPVNQ